MFTVAPESGAIRASALLSLSPSSTDSSSTSSQRRVWISFSRPFRDLRYLCSKGRVTNRRTRRRVARSRQSDLRDAIRREYEHEPTIASMSHRMRYDCKESEQSGTITGRQLKQKSLIFMSGTLNVRILTKVAGEFTVAANTLRSLLHRGHGTVVSPRIRHGIAREKTALFLLVTDLFNTAGASWVINLSERHLSLAFDREHPCLVPPGRGVPIGG